MDIDNPLSQSIAEQLRDKTGGRKGMPVKALAEATGIKLVTLSRYINGKRDIPAPLFALICKELGLDPGEVLRNAIEEFTRANPAGN
ncbi:helix-turn-helix domain-containing protein [Glutamicibacter nicotianae]|uniref:helix-turn-helix domain-containing protein n=1 Tax=Glutamicibacter nicotianae TaxID=37929 RepID=UPI00255754B0|nr:helix-turn-helix transcriptional regulator [Glutamicibacter nicotianae]WIV44501.1 helix-turn-helix transcriptional regulator [Glutamicibacter nicotianae]